MTKPSSAINDYLVRELQPAAHDPTQSPDPAVRERQKTGASPDEAQVSPDTQQAKETAKQIAKVKTT